MFGSRPPELNQTTPGWPCRSHTHWPNVVSHQSPINKKRILPGSSTHQSKCRGVTITRALVLDSPDHDSRHDPYVPGSARHIADTYIQDRVHYFCACCCSPGISLSCLSPSTFLRPADLSPLPVPHHSLGLTSWTAAVVVRAAGARGSGDPVVGHGRLSKHRGLS